jgi:hypothetical protein
MFGLTHDQWKRRLLISDLINLSVGSKIIRN